MLKDVLVSINNNGYLSKSILAKEMNVSEALIDESIKQLIRMRYITEDQGTSVCSSSCGGCPFATFCSKEFVKMYKVTDKGNSLLSK
ncbi:MAG: FeoC-like transcriptional regulator [Sphaerochaetaceae bacterium]|jgi:CRISPR/Cas system-associated exonuclease Cas4 (RecB family)